MKQTKASGLREYEITTRRPEGGKLTHVNVVQGNSGVWHITVRKNWGDDREYEVHHYNHSRLKTYKRISSALRHIVLDYQYEGPIIVVPCVGKSHTKSF